MKFINIKHQFSIDRSLSLDETALALNPLDTNQVALIGFLYIEKIQTTFVNKGDRL